MSIVQLPSDQLAALRAEDVQLYLASHGWKRDEQTSTSRGNVYRIRLLTMRKSCFPVAASSPTTLSVWPMSFRCCPSSSNVMYGM